MVMHHRIMFVLLALAVTTSAGHARQSGQTLKFAAGANAATVKGSIVGRKDRTYVVAAKAGQTLQMLFSPSNRSCYVNVFEPGNAQPVHVGSQAGNEFGRSATVDGAYRFQIYLMRNAARRGERCRFSLGIELSGQPGGSSAGVSDVQMRDRCKGEAAPMYGVPPRRISVRKVKAVAAGFTIDGTANKGAEGIKNLRCIFKPDRTFSHVMATTTDGE